MRALLVDDEAPARQRLARLLAEFPQIQVVAEASNGLEALELIRTHAPDLVFLDIEMPELDGIAVSQAIGEGGPRVVFVTAYSDYAVKAFETYAVDYVLKPILP